jgi:hypothetical protein
MLLLVLWKLHEWLQRLILSSLTTLIYLGLALSVAHFFGWIERWIWWTLEREASKILNGAKVTLGSFQLDWSQILQGKITLHASNVVLHTPQRDVWQWESPLIARVGKASVECNAPITIFHIAFLRKELPIEVYSVQVSDVQVFVERYDNVFNVYLLDPNVVLPPPPPTPRPTNDTSDPRVSFSKESSTSGLNDSDSILETPLTATTTGDSAAQHKEQAQQLVQDMLQAVQSLGRAAQQGSLQGAIKQQGMEMAEKLRGLSKKENLEEGVRVMQQVGKVAVESFASPILLAPARKVGGGGGPKPPLARVGRIVLQEVRIFTKDSWIQIVTEEEQQQSANGGASAAAGAGWNKPIFIESLIVRASELCPPMSLKDDQQLPAVYQTIDKIIEIVWRRLLAEMAKSNTGRLFQTAVGEVLSFIKSNPTGTSTTTPPSTTTTAATSSNTTTGSTTTKQSKRKSATIHTESSSAEEVQV